MRRRLFATTVCLTVAIALPTAGAGGSSPTQRLYFQRGSAIVAMDTASPGHVVVVDRHISFGVSALSDADHHIFWIEQRSGRSEKGSIWRAREDGRDPHPIVADVSAVQDATAEIGQSLYWIDAEGISSAALNGGDVHRDVIPLPQENGGGVAEDLVTDGQYLYFSRCQDGTVGRVAADGSGLDMGFITLPGKACPQGLAVGGGFVYWTDLGIAGIGRAKLDGTDADDHWLHVGGQLGPFNLAADASVIYWTHGTDQADGGKGYIGRANADGTDLKQVLFSDPQVGSLALSP